MDKQTYLTARLIKAGGDARTVPQIVADLETVWDALNPPPAESPDDVVLFKRSRIAGTDTYRIIRKLRDGRTEELIQ
ncbi:MAG: hypothetical protein ACPGO3_13305 [Magnetospiraceae bacterium]